MLCNISYIRSCYIQALDSTQTDQCHLFCCMESSRIAWFNILFDKCPLGFGGDRYSV